MHPGLPAIRFAPDPALPGRARNVAMFQRSAASVFQRKAIAGFIQPPSGSGVNRAYCLISTMPTLNPRCRSRISEGGARSRAGALSLRIRVLWFRKLPNHRRLTSPHRHPPVARQARFPCDGAVRRCPAALCALVPADPRLRGGDSNSKSRAIAVPRGGEFGFSLPLYANQIQKPLALRKTATNRRPGGRNGDRAAPSGLDSAPEKQFRIPS